MGKMEFFCNKFYKKLLKYYQYGNNQHFPQ